MSRLRDNGDLVAVRATCSLSPTTEITRYHTAVIGCGAWDFISRILRTESLRP